MIEDKKIVEERNNDDKVTINLDKGKIINITKEKNYTSSPDPPLIKDILYNWGEQ
jgi:3-isopropylmalate dehydratase small subunit